MPFLSWVGIDPQITVPLTLSTAAGANPALGVQVVGDSNNRGQWRGNGVIGFGPGGAGLDLFVQRAAGPVLQVNAPVDISNVGSTVQIAEGANAKQGTAVLAAGSAVVANTSVTANSRIQLTSNLDGGTPGFLRVSARTAGTSFTITSSSGTDTSTVAYTMFEPG